jgi:NAD+ synthase (glutamine-hydrolysing)
MSMYAINTGIPKTLIRYLVEWTTEIYPDISDVLHDILATPVSPELLPPEDNEIAQKTEEVVGPYELHDFFLYHMIKSGAEPKKILFLANTAFKRRYDEATLKKWLKLFLRRFFSQQFKRSCIPDGPKVGTIALSPRGDWRMPSDAEVDAWIKGLDGSGEKGADSF